MRPHIFQCQTRMLKQCLGNCCFWAVIHTRYVKYQSYSVCLEIFLKVLLYTGHCYLLTAPSYIKF